MGAPKTPFLRKAGSTQPETIPLCFSDRSSSSSGESHTQVIQKKSKRYARWATEHAGQRHCGNHTVCLPRGMEITQCIPDSLKSYTLLKDKGCPGQGAHSQDANADNGNKFLPCARRWVKHSILSCLFPKTNPMRREHYPILRRSKLRPGQVRCLA